METFNFKNCCFCLFAEDFGQIHLSDSFQPHHFSYNMYEY